MTNPYSPISRWGSQLLPTPEQRAAQRPQIYTENQYAGLGGYNQAKPSQWEQGNESDVNYVMRLKDKLQVLTDQLPPGELATVAEHYNAALQRVEGGTSHEQLRTHLDARQSGVERGLFGAMSATDRGAMVQASMSRPGAQGGLSDSVGPAPARVFASQVEQRVTR